VTHVVSHCRQSLDLFKTLLADITSPCIADLGLLLNCYAMQLTLSVCLCTDCAQLFLYVVWSIQFVTCHDYVLCYQTWVYVNHYRCVRFCFV